MNGVSVEVRECSFTGKLGVGSHYIDGKLINENAQKLVVKKCSFNDNQINSINLAHQKSLKNSLNVDNLNDYISINFNDQTFKKDYNNDENMSFEMISLAAILTVGLMVSCLIVFVLNKLNHRNTNDIEDDLNA